MTPSGYGKGFKMIACLDVKYHGGEYGGANMVSGTFFYSRGEYGGEYGVRNLFLLPLNTPAHQFGGH